jgi:hypothetical protein
MEKFLHTLCDHYKHDTIAPGLQLAYLPEKKQYYCAVHRFLTGNINSRKVVAKAVEDDLIGALIKCAKIWQEIVDAEKAASNGVN